MATFRHRALNEAASHVTSRHFEEKGTVSSYFGQNVLDLERMKGYMSPKAYEAVLSSVRFGAKLDRSVADQIADGMKAWALDMGATHYTHLFQPLTDSTAEKHEERQPPRASRFPTKHSRSRWKSRKCLTPT